MMNYSTSNMLMNHQSILLPIKFNLTWISDIEMRNLLLDYYLTQDMVYPSEQLMTLKIQNKADLISEYWNKLYELKSIKYAPIENYDRYEDIEDVGTSSSTSNTNTESNVFEFPMQTPDKKQTSNSNGTGQGNASGNTNNKHKAHIHGNIGVTTSQQMLESEIELQKQLSMLKQDYIKEYNDLFIITI